MSEPIRMQKAFGSLARRLATVIVTCAVTSTLAVSYLAFVRSETSLEASRLQALEAVAQAKESVVVEVLRMHAEQGTTIARSNTVDMLFSNAGRPEPTATPELMRERLRALVDDTSLEWVAVTDASGQVLASTGGDREATRLDVGSRDVPEGPTWTSMRRDADGAVYRLVVPITKRATRVGAVLADVRADRIWSVLLDRTGLGRTGETYLMSAADGTYLSPLLGDDRAALRARDLEGAHAFLRRGGRRTSGTWTSHRRIEAIGFVKYDDLRGLGVGDWVVVCEMGRDEALAPVSALRRDVALLAVVCALLVLVVGYVVARRWTAPLARLVEAATRIGSGDLRSTPRIEARDDEIGLLSSTFVGMHGGLRDALGALRSGVEALAKNAAEVGASTRKYASASAAQVAAVASTSTSLAETRRGSTKTADAAQGVLEATEAAAAAGRRGLEAIDAGVEAMDALEDRVRGIASEALELSQQSTRIGQIVATVNDLSEQSNVLAVNASVEAAKAGERGRGFQVVAVEVRRLAEQSKRATQQIKKILGDVQRAVESVVMAAEDGTKRSEDGRRAIGVIRSAVHELAATLEQNADSAQRIASSAADQATGIAQLGGALETMERSAEQTAKEVASLERATSTLEALGRDLARAAARYEL